MRTTIPDLHERRLRLGLRQVDLAREACTDQKTISNAENGRRLNGSTAKLIEDAVRRIERRRT